MKTFAFALTAAAIALSAGSTFAATNTDLDLDAAIAAPATQTAEQAPYDVADETVQVAYGCDYVIMWDAWGNYYYEYVCY